MDKDSRFVGLDVHAETIAVGVAEPGGEVRSLGTIPNTPEAVRRLVKKLGPPETLRVCYEAGPHRVRAVPAAECPRGAVCGDRPNPGAGEGGRSSEDGSARRREARPQLSQRGPDARLGARPRPRSAARSGARAGGGEEGSAPRPA